MLVRRTYTLLVLFPIRSRLVRDDYQQFRRFTITSYSRSHRRASVSDFQTLAGEYIWHPPRIKVELLPFDVREKSSLVSGGWRSRSRPSVSTSHTLQETLQA